jgi:hypothetical protein
VYDVARWTLLLAVTVGVPAAIAVALFGPEVAGSWASSRQQTQTTIAALELQNSAMKAEWGKASDEATRIAAEAKKSVSAANERATVSEKRAAEARLALEKYKAPRILSPEQQSQLTERLRQFERTPFEFSVTPDPEAIALMGQLAMALTESGWEWNVTSPLVFRNANRSDAEVHAVFGVQIQVDERKKQQWERPAIELRETLHAAGIEVTAEVVKAGSNDPSAIHIRIDHKS